MYIQMHVNFIILTTNSKIGNHQNVCSGPIEQIAKHQKMVYHTAFIKNEVGS